MKAHQAISHREAPLNGEYDVTEAKSRSSELLSRAAYGGERILIRKRGKPVAAIVSAEHLGRSMDETQADAKTGRGLIAAVGLMADVPEWEAFMREVYRSRQTSTDRPVDTE